MRVYLKPSSEVVAPQPDSSSHRARRGPNGDGGDGGTLSPFRELLTEFRNLTERYGQALLALGEARGEVAALRGRVELLEARMEVRLPPAPTAWPTAPISPEPEKPAMRAPAREAVRAPMPAEPRAAEPVPAEPTHAESGPAEPMPAEALAAEPPPAEPTAAETTPAPTGAAVALEVGSPPAEAEPVPAAEAEAPAAVEETAAAAAPASDEKRARRRRRADHSAIAGIAAALARAEDPTLSDLPGGAEVAAALAALRSTVERAQPLADAATTADVEAGDEAVAAEAAADKAEAAPLIRPEPVEAEPPAPAPVAPEPPSAELGELPEWAPPEPPIVEPEAGETLTGVERAEEETEEALVLAAPPAPADALPVAEEEISIAAAGFEVTGRVERTEEEPRHPAGDVQAAAETGAAVVSEAAPLEAEPPQPEPTGMPEDAEQAEEAVVELGPDSPYTSRLAEPEWFSDTDLADTRTPTRDEHGEPDETPSWLEQSATALMPEESAEQAPEELVEPTEATSTVEPARASSGAPLEADDARWAPSAPEPWPAFEDEPDPPSPSDTTDTLAHGSPSFGSATAAPPVGPIEPTPRQETEAGPTAADPDARPAGEAATDEHPGEEEVMWLGEAAGSQYAEEMEVATGAWRPPEREEDVAAPPPESAPPSTDVAPGPPVADDILFEDWDERGGTLAAHDPPVERTAHEAAPSAPSAVAGGSELDDTLHRLDALAQRERAPSEAQRRSDRAEEVVRQLRAQMQELASDPEAHMRRSDATPSAQPPPPRPIARAQDASVHGPAARAYRRLRRIFPS
jgi:hypothetical protein